MNNIYNDQLRCRYIKFSVQLGLLIIIINIHLLLYQLPILYVFQNLEEKDFSGTQYLLRPT